LRCGFLFLYFHFCFLQKYIFVFEINRNIPRPPAAGRPGPGRPAAGRQGLFCKKIHEEFALRSLEDRSPGSGAAGPQAARQRGGWICKIILIIAKVSPATPEIKVRLMIGKLNHFSNCEHQST